MTERWAISGRDLHVEVGGNAVRTSLEESLRLAVREGRLPAGALLPPTRTLAADLGISRNTVANAYDQLVAEGWLTARQGSGTRVADAAVEQAPSPQPPARAPAPAFDLRAGFPDVSSFPRSAWIAASRAAINAAPASTFGYADVQGLPVLREAVSGYLARARGVRVTPERVVICSGFTRGLSIVGAVLHAQGARRVAVESHGHRQHRDLLAGLGLSCQPVPVDALGAHPPEAADIALLTPAHQFPLGVALDPVRRAAFLEWATGTDGVIVEDDYDAEFRYDRRPIGALQALAPEHVAYLGTVSKTLAPGIRLGWMVLPARLIGPAVERLARDLALPSVLDQLTLAELIRSGGYDRHIRRSRLAYRRRRDVLVRQLGRATPALELEGLPAGMHAVLSLPHGADESAVVADAASRGLALDGLAHYAAPGQLRPPALVIGYATPPEHAYTSALARLTATIQGAGRSG